MEILEGKLCYTGDGELKTRRVDGSMVMEGMRILSGMRSGFQKYIIMLILIFFIYPLMLKVE
ncbi:hypothetical protein [Acidiplasma sp.]|uniref:hypothetical protein n=1 Tax=Acidiplasma sp. TaxID=1872114 RepID=UPI002583F712|nr:hypothetical protein [Acidiplasma sp.]